jgi:hypothetical protein
MGDKKDKEMERGRAAIRRFYGLFYGNTPYEPDPTFPTELRIGGRVYDIMHFLKVGEVFIMGRDLSKRGRELRAEGDHKHVDFIIKNQGDIPKKFRKRVCFIFPNLINMWGARDYEYLEVVFWSVRANQWKWDIDWVNYHGWNNDDGHRLVRLRAKKEKTK